MIDAGQPRPSAPSRSGGRRRRQPSPTRSHLINQIAIAVIPLGRHPLGPRRASTEAVKGLTEVGKEDRHRDRAAACTETRRQPAILRQILLPVEADLAGLRDRALLLLGFAGAPRRAELAAILVGHLEPCDRGLRLILPNTKGERTGRSVTVAIPFGSTELCPVRALRQWQQAASITESAVFRRIWVPPRGRTGHNTPLPRVGANAIDAGTVARIVQARAAAAGFDPAVLGGHSLKRGALSTGMDRGVHPTRLRQLGRYKSYAVLDVYLELGDPFEGHPLNGVLRAQVAPHGNGIPQAAVA
jgi:hypothetical protein